MVRFVELNEAATMLGVTPEKLVEMRSNGDIHGYRDGGSWKFKAEEIDRVATELAAGGSASGVDDDMFSFDSAVDDVAETPKEDESILVSEEELGDSAESTSSTIIGKLGEAEDPDSDLPLVDGSHLELGDEVAEDSPSDLASISSGLGSSLELDDAASLDSSGKLNAEEPDVESDVTLVPGAGTDSDVALVPDPGSSGELAADSGLGSALELASGTGTDTGNLPDVSSDSGGSGDMELGSELALSDDDDMVLGGSDTGSDLALGAGDNGISLGSPSDSGLSLEADSGISLQSATDSGLSLEESGVDLGGSSISSLELPEDEELVSLDDAEEIAPVVVQKDEEFMLSPSDEMMGDESDSGSQVIALEDSEAFDQDAATMLQDAGGGQALLAETAGLEAQLDSLGGGAPATAIAPDAAPAYAPAAELNEAPYSIWNLMGLMMIMLFLGVSGVLMMDIVRNMWAWEEARDVSTSISDGVTTAFGMNKK